jgi:uncharacterized phage protein (TIGR02218 family)
MSRIWFSSDLETVATFWRVMRRDGVTLGFTSHDRDLWFDGVLHRAGPGMVPSSIRRSADFEPDSAEVQGALSHASITAGDLAQGRFDGAQVRIGLVDWESGIHEVLYRGAIGGVTDESGRFSAELVSRKSELMIDPIPRTGPSCRAQFCGPGCNLNPALFDHAASLAEVDFAINAVRVAAIDDFDRFAGGTLRWLGGPHAGAGMTIMAVTGEWLVLDWPLAPDLATGVQIILREGCDHTIETCATWFANAVNFQAEPYLPGNDMISRYPSPPQ